MKSAFIIIFLITGALNNKVHSARRIDARERAKSTLKTRDALSKRALGMEDVSISELLNLSTDETMHVKRNIKTSQGIRVEKLQERYKGIPVFDSSVVVEIDLKGKLTGDASGVFVQGIEDDISSPDIKLTPQQALEVVLKFEGDDVIASVEDFVYSEEIYLDKNDTARITYYLKYLINNNHTVKRPAFIIDTQTGEVLSHWESLDTYHPRCSNKINGFGGNEKVGRFSYNKEPYCLQLKKKGKRCYLENKYVRVIDMKNSENLLLNKTASFVCCRGYKDKTNGAFSPAMDAFLYGTIIGKMFDDWFQAQPLTEKIVLRVHFGNFYANAYWDGKYCVFGDGNYLYYPLVSLDMICHEIGHGVTEQSSDLLYFNHSGGINEAFSDIIGEACGYYFRSYDFLVGANIIKPHGPRYIREFENPAKDGYSIEHVKDFESGMDPHYSSGIFRKVFYILTNKKGVDFKQAVKVFYHANTIYWHHLSSFEDAACSVLKSAYDLGQNLNGYSTAFKEVGIEPCDLLMHIRSLVQDRTYDNILVSIDSQPMFAFKCPIWAEIAIVNASSSNGEVGITYTIGTWNTTLNSQDQNVEEHDSYKDYVEIPDISGKFIFITLFSPKGQYMDDVSINVGYRCQENFISPHFNIMEWYKYHCGKGKET